MSEDYKIQLSFKPQNRLDNLRANTWEEMDALLAGYGDRVAMINGIENLANSGVAGAFTPPVSAPVSAAPAAPVTPPTAPESTGHTCRHGQMKYLEQISKKTGNPYKGYFCPSTNRADQCDPQFIR